MNLHKRACLLGTGILLHTGHDNNVCVCMILDPCIQYGLEECKCTPGDLYVESYYGLCNIVFSKCSYKN